MQTFPKPLTPGEERACLERLQEGDREARDILIERNLRLVAHVAKKYQGTDYEQDDLLSVGTIGLIKAVNTFHPERGSRLATYAAKCIENEILMMFRAGKKYSREVSLFEPIGVDKDGESVSLVDVIELETKEVLGRSDPGSGYPGAVRGLFLLLKAPGAVGGKAALRPFRGEAPHPARNRRAAWYFPILCIPD